MDTESSSFKSSIMQSAMQKSKHTRPFQSHYEQKVKDYVCAFLCYTIRIQCVKSFSARFSILSS